MAKQKFERNTTRNTMTDAMSTAVQSSRKYDAPMKEAMNNVKERLEW